MTGVDEEKPIVSLLADDPLERPRIEAFVLALSEAVDTLQDLEQTGQFARIAERSLALAQDAERHGFPPLAAAGHAVAQASLAAELKETRDTLIVLTEISRRVRLGHRGAAPPGL